MMERNGEIGKKIKTLSFSVSEMKTKPPFNEMKMPALL